MECSDHLGWPSVLSGTVALLSAVAVADPPVRSPAPQSHLQVCDQDWFVLSNPPPATEAATDVPM